MPKVGKKSYPYTKAGVKAAKRAAKASGNSMVSKRKPKETNEY